ncbi:MAG: hypothetical protein N4A35_16245 [Flavobacteriales bacterium]|jgi:hypothetical protein|nr:hypothetical protein [Flavobacteriales bacterium]
MKGQTLIESYQNIWDKYKNSSINTSTRKYEKNLLDRGFTFQFDEGIKDVDILFVGINPSYDGESTNSSIYTREQALGHYYFKPFGEIQRILKDDYKKELTWAHLDLLVFKETEQAFIRDVLFKSADGLNFIVEQLDIAKSILEYLNPKVIVVSNTQARTLLGADRNNNKNIWMGYEFEFDEKLGTRKIVNPKLNSYCFFTSMLSGQRALDKGSKERLIWHIDYVFNFIRK